MDENSLSCIHIRFAEESDQQAWDQYVWGHPTGTAYQLFGWAKAVESAYHFPRICLLAECQEQICGILPLIEMRAPFGRAHMVSLPYCDCGGVLADNEDIAQLIIKSAISVVGCGKRISMRSNQPLPFAGNNRTSKVRMVLNLPENSTHLLAGLKSKVRSQVKKPLRDGLHARIGGCELIREFYGVFSKNMRDLGSPVHSCKWIQAIADEYRERMRVAVVYTPDGIPAASGIMLSHAQTAVMPWASSLRRYNNMNPNMLLYWTFLAYAADNGYTHFDFGRSSPGEGTWRFKQQWGAIPEPLYWYEINGIQSSHDPIAQEKTSSWRRIAACLWSCLPATATNRIGPRIRKYISL